MLKRQLNHFSYGCHLLPAASNVIISNSIHFLFLFSLNGLSLVKYHGVRCHNAVFGGFRLHNFVLDCQKIPPDEEGITFVNWPKAIFEIGYHQISGQIRKVHTLDGVVEGQDLDTSGIWDIRTRVNLDHVTVAHSQVVANYAVHTYLFVIKLICSHSDAHGLLPHFALNDHGVSLEYFELIHFMLSHFNERIVVLGRVFHKKLVRSFYVF